MAFFSHPLAIAYIYVFLGAAFNLVTAFMLKKAEGFTVFWPSFIALVCICLTQFLLSRAMRAGLDVGLSVALVVVTVMLGSCIMGVALFGEALSMQKIAGLAVAIIGVAIAALA